MHLVATHIGMNVDFLKFLASIQLGNPPLSLMKFSKIGLGMAPT
jgi:hypothetical protein